MELASDEKFNKYYIQVGSENRKEGGGEGKKREKMREHINRIDMVNI